MTRRLNVVLVVLLALFAALLFARVADATDTNHEEYWETLLEADCTKHEGHDGSIPVHYDYVIVKAGNDPPEVFEDVAAGSWVYHSNGKDLSWVMKCNETPPPTTTTTVAETTTTTEPSTTTTTEVPSSSTTTMPPSSTTTSEPPPTTSTVPEEETTTTLPVTSTTTVVTTVETLPETGLDADSWTAALAAAALVALGAVALVTIGRERLDKSDL